MIPSHPYTPENTPPSISCLVCGTALLVRSARGRKSGKPFLMLMCRRDGRHFRAFVNDQAYVRSVLDRLEDQTRAERSDDGEDPYLAPSESSGADLERRSEDVE